MFDHFVNSSLNQKLAARYIGERVTALGLIHVMRRDQHGDALRGEPVNLFPEVAACARDPRQQ